MDVVIDCVCPGGHAQDTVTLRDKLDFITAASMQKSIDMLKADNADATNEEILATLLEAYVRFGVSAWTLVDVKGEPIPARPSMVERYLLTHVAEAMVVASHAEDLYTEAVLLPLIKAGSTSSPPMPTTESTSPETSSPDESHTPSSPSSTTTTQTGGTVTTSRPRGGGSRSSQSSASAA